MWDLLELVLDLLSWSGGRRSNPRRAQSRWTRTGLLPCALRVVSGHHPGLDHTWTRTQAKVSYGQIEAAGHTMDITELSPRWRPASRRERWRVSGDAVVVQARTSTGVVLDWVVDRLTLNDVRPRLNR